MTNIIINKSNQGLKNVTTFPTFIKSKKFMYYEHCKNVKYGTSKPKVGMYGECKFEVDFDTNRAQTYKWVFFPM